jgi:O-antigen ligase
MLSSASNKLIKINDQLIWSLIIIISLTVALISDIYLVGLVPFVLLVLYVVVSDYSILYYLFFLILPFSIEVYLPNGLGTDLPSEPIMWCLTGLGLLIFISKSWQGKTLHKYMNPITFMLIAHLTWLTFTVMTATDATRSFKFLLAKIWYVIPFYFLTIHFLKSNVDVRKMFKLLIASLTISMIYVIINHAAEGFSFKTSNDVVQPFFRNHVNYAAMLVLLVPYVLMGAWFSKRKWIYGLLILFFIVCIYFSFTRAAMVGLFIGIGAFYIIKSKLVKPVLLTCLIGASLGITYLSTNNNFLKLAPNFEKTITHNKFDNLIEATYKMEDISTMERLYRWVAGFEMIQDKPLVGFGPNNFYINYSKYALSAFQTYVSDNPDHSGVHNYYLMTAVDQGIPGLLIFIGLILVALIIGENTFHQLKDREDKVILMTSLISLIIILSLNLINDILETDKIGPFFFISLAIIGIYYQKVRQLEIKQ